MIEKSENDNDINMSDKRARISFKNNCFLFRPEDWNRLKSICVRNLDEKKVYIIIHMCYTYSFGVGFYSLTSVCDNPR